MDEGGLRCGRYESEREQRRGEEPRFETCVEGDGGLINATTP